MAYAANIHFHSIQRLAERVSPAFPHRDLVLRARFQPAESLPDAMGEATAERIARWLGFDDLEVGSVREIAQSLSFVHEMYVSLRDKAGDVHFELSDGRTEWRVPATPTNGTILMWFVGSDGTEVQIYFSVDAVDEVITPVVSEDLGGREYAVSRQYFSKRAVVTLDPRKRQRVARFEKQGFTLYYYFGFSEDDYALLPEHRDHVWATILPEFLRGRTIVVRKPDSDGSGRASQRAENLHAYLLDIVEKRVEEMPHASLEGSAESFDAGTKRVFSTVQLIPGGLTPYDVRVSAADRDVNVKNGVVVEAIDPSSELASESRVAPLRYFGLAVQFSVAVFYGSRSAIVGLVRVGEVDDDWEFLLEWQHLFGLGAEAQVGVALVLVTGFEDPSSMNGTPESGTRVTLAFGPAKLKVAKSLGTLDEVIEGVAATASSVDDAEEAARSVKRYLKGARVANQVKEAAKDVQDFVTPEPAFIVVPTPASLGAGVLVGHAWGGEREVIPG